MYRGNDAWVYDAALGYQCRLLSYTPGGAMTYSRQAVPTKEEIRQECGELRRNGLRFWMDMDTNRFWDRGDAQWSPADNVRHLILSTVPVARGLHIPRWVFRVLFGLSPTSSRTWDALRSTYLDRLASGGTAGRYAPALVDAPRYPETEQKQLVGQCESTVLRLERAVQRWQDLDLDRYRLPHPLLGLLTVREMVMFTLFHFDHHRERVARRLMESEGHSANHSQ